jgi:2-polyprenyl-3-methyl-5-hydroxy-6-metoxy-1,4-benzoquinol methylase
MREEDIRPRDLMLSKVQCVVDDRDFLLSEKEAWETVACPACDMWEVKPHFAKDGFAYVQCLNCETVYTSPRPTPALLKDFYEQSKNYAFWNEYIFPATEESRRLGIFRPRALRLAAILEANGVRGGTLLEVGAAFGLFCDEVRALGVFDHVIAVEPTPGLAETCRNRGLTVVESVIENYETSVEIDVVAAFEVIEHLASPADFLRQCARLLRPNGLIVLSCPNVRGFDVATLGPLSNTFDHEHLNYFHPSSMATLLERCDLELVEVLTPGELDADLVRQQALSGSIDLDGQPFLREVLLDRWDELGDDFQHFLQTHNMSSHMWVVARTRGAE